MRTNKSPTYPKTIDGKAFDRQGYHLGQGGQFFDNMDDEWLTTKEAAEFLKISPSRLLNLCSLGEIPYSKLKRRNRYLKSDLQSLLLTTKKGGC